MGRRRAARGTGLATALVGVLLTVACGSGYSPSGPFRELPRGAPPEVAPPTGSAPAPVPGDPSTPGSSDEQAGDPNVVATELTVPTGLVVLPDGTAVVGERDSGRLLQVFPDRSPARELMTVPGIDTGGDGGLLGLALSPTFPEDGLYYAYLSTATDNRVVRFPVGGTPNPVLTGIPRGEVRNGGGLLFGSDGTLYVGTGDTGDPALAADPASLAGKVLAVDVFGQPVGADPVFSRGHSDVTALCSGGDERVFATDNLPTGPDEFDALVAGGDQGPDGTGPVLTVPEDEAGLAGCAVSGPYVFLGALTGRKVVTAELDGTGAPVGDPADFLPDRYGRLRSVALDPTGALWITTSNKDGAGTPEADDDRVLRVLPPSSAADSPL
ncbi:sorbosone dehydrogenase family protein [Modestobacter sp. DSM 44400]|uniref:PQQ-dependent sugar dehydrogenase n=1 Tax=Modestobacter sp. DSM 44400 TaxID=1550230 RepID=UPI000B87C22F|nr:PQQ-dependent sugar dehydrogenase [Modestobacter sp. DSM 44400]